MYNLGTSASKQGALLIEGTPVIVKDTNSYTLYITVKNAGNIPVNITSVIINNITWNISGTTTLSINPGAVVSFSAISSTTITLSSQTVNGVLQTSAGTIPFVAIVQS
jgi:hypothetical protein